MRIKSEGENSGSADAGQENPVAWRVIGEAIDLGLALQALHYFAHGDFLRECIERSSRLDFLYALRAGV
jgi:hypothetical protein